MTPGRSSRRAAITEWKKALTKEKADELVESALKPMHVLPPPSEKFNYIVDIRTYWRGKCLYFCATYRSQRADAPDPFFEIRFARMEYLGSDRFALSFMRGNGSWVKIYPDLSQEECLTSIRDDPFFIP